MKRFLSMCFCCSFAIFIILLFLLDDAELHIRLMISLLAGSALSAYMENIIFGKESSKGSRQHQHSTVSSSPAHPKPVYIHKPFENKIVYRIEYRHGKQYVFEGLSNNFIYRIEGNMVYRGTDPKVYYRRKGNKIFRDFEYKEPVYRIEGNELYPGNFGRKPVYVISSKTTT